MIVIINYSIGNLGSILNMFKKIGAEVTISSEISDIEKADKLILPGVGAFDNSVKNINDLGLVPVLNNRVVENKIPILGICIGMQLFTKRSEEGSLPGLGWIDAETVRFKFDNIAQTNLKIPHMGWNNIKIKKHNAIFQDNDAEFRFYFVHSYHVSCFNQEDVLTTTHHGYEFASSVQKENIIGVQFHPEKSHKFGMNLFKKFVEL